MTGANGFLKKNECTVVWAAFRDRNFEVGLPKAMSVPSKYNKKCTCASKRTLFIRKQLFFARQMFEGTKKMYICKEIAFFRTLRLCFSLPFALSHRVCRSTTAKSCCSLCLGSEPLP